MSLRIVVVERARRELVEADKWCRENRSDPDLIEREVSSAISLLLHHPEAGALFLRARRRGIRRLLLRKTQHHIYYRFEAERRTLRILAFWHTAREHSPGL
ncbi:MAG TPA: type II toxin-antitoxin system RelE/ParE family toxin [Polyangiaceae bacterium]|jgi:plasmid stabilization system protein ParE|nr:type II toxin-antitoxin system RelE/ParE family toxin [Polyangiaceae bacterium]